MPDRRPILYRVRERMRYCGQCGCMRTDGHPACPRCSAPWGDRERIIRAELRRSCEPGYYDIWPTEPTTAAESYAGRDGCVNPHVPDYVAARQWPGAFPDGPPPDSSG